MVDAKRLLDGLKKLRRILEADLREQHAASPQRTSVQIEWQTALNARGTADTFETFWSAALDQAAVHWILAVVFIRFLGDKRLLDRPFLSGTASGWTSRWSGSAPTFARSRWTPTPTCGYQLCHPNVLSMEPAEPGD